MSEEAPPGLMTISQAARWLGMEGEAGSRRLRRYMLRLESERGRSVMIRRGKGASKRYYLTERVLRRHAPELIPVRKRLPKEAKKAIGQLRDELDQANDRVDDLEARLFALAERVRRISTDRQ